MWIDLGCALKGHHRFQRDTSMREHFHQTCQPLKRSHNISPDFKHVRLFSDSVGGNLEAQQRYCSYRAILVAIVSQNSFVLVFVEYPTNIARYAAKRGIAQSTCDEPMYQGGDRTILGSANLPERVSRHMGYRSDNIAISRDTGPLRVAIPKLKKVRCHNPEPFVETT